MVWADFYLICFIVGFAFSLISWLPCGLHFHAHLPHWMHISHHGFGSHHIAGHGDDASFFNFPTIMTFLAWFGGIGYLLTRFTGFWFLLILGLALAAGFAGASMVFWFLAKVLLAHDHTMNPADFRMVGTLGTVRCAIRPGGTGEIEYSQGGARRFCSARSDDGALVPKGTEVVVTRYEKGVAYICPWEQMLEKDKG